VSLPSLVPRHGQDDHVAVARATADKTHHSANATTLWYPWSTESRSIQVCVNIIIIIIIKEQIKVT